MCIRQAIRKHLRRQLEKPFDFILGLFIYFFSILCGPVVSSTVAHGFVHTS